MNKSVTFTLPKYVGIMFVVVGGVFTVVSVYSLVFTLNITIALVIAFMGAVFVVIGIISTLRYLRAKDTVNKLIKTGEKITAEIVGIKMEYRYQRYRNYARRLVCEYNGRAFESTPIWVADDSNIGNKITVYVDKSNPKNYYVDLSNFVNEKEIIVK